MRSVRKLVLLAIALLLWTAGPAAASPRTWQAYPGGPFTASGPLTLATGSGVQVPCDWVVLHGVAPVGPPEDPIATFPELPGAEFSGCVGPFGLVVEFSQVGDWYMHGGTYDSGSDTMTGTIGDIAVDMTGPGCAVTFTGYVNYLYNNTTGQLDIFPDATLTVAFVDPVNNCLGLIGEGERLALSGTLFVDPIQRFVS